MPRARSVQAASDNTSPLGNGDKPSRPLERYIQVLEMLAAFPVATLPELAHVLGMPKTTVYRLLKGLVQSGLVTPGPGRSGGYMLAPRLLRLLHLGGTGSELELVAQPHLQQLAEETNLTSYIAKLTGTTVRSVVMRAPSAHWCLYVVPGSEMTPHATASAKAILAFQSEKVVAAALARPLRKFTSNTKTDMTQVLAEYEQVRRTGFATCFAEDVDGFGAVACPIAIPKVGVVYSVGLTGPLDVILKVPMQAYVATLNGYAERLALAIETGNHLAHVQQQRGPERTSASAAEARLPADC